MVSFSAKRCPRCGSRSIKSLERKRWMRWIPTSKYFRCGLCKGRHLEVFNTLVFRVS
jgi:hypothetical protein